MKKLMICLAVMAVVLVPFMASAQNVTKGSVQRLNLDSITLDGTVVTATGTEINKAADISLNVESVSQDFTLDTSDCGGTIVFASTAGLTGALPDVTSGCKIKAIVGTVATSSAHSLYTSDLSNIIACGINELEVDDTEDGPYQADADNVNFGSSGLSSAIGDFAEFLSDGTTWFCNGQANADGAISLSSS